MTEFLTLLTVVAWIACAVFGVRNFKRTEHSPHWMWLALLHPLVAIAMFGVSAALARRADPTPGVRAVDSGSAERGDLSSRQADQHRGEGHRGAPDSDSEAHIVGGGRVAGMTGNGSDKLAIKPRVDRLGAAQMLFDTSAKLWKEGDGDERKKALSMLASCIEEYPEFTRAHCALTRVLLTMDPSENLEIATQIMRQAYEVNPDDEEVYKNYAVCFMRKGSLLWEEGDLKGAYDCAKTAMKIEGFDDQSFALTRTLAKQLDELEDFALHCVDLGIDPLRDFDLSNVRPYDAE